MEPIELLAIIKLTTLILRRNFKHFLCITFLWVILFAFHLPVIDTSFLALDTLVGSSLTFYRLIISKEQILLPPSLAASLDPHITSTEHPTDLFPKLRLASFFPIIVRFFFSVAISLFSHPLLAFSVCRSCLNKTLCLKGSLLGVVRSVTNLALTFLCVGVVVFGFASLTFVVMGIIAMLVALVTGLNEPATILRVVSCIPIAMEFGGLYLAVLFSLAQTAATLEEKTRGWGAIWRSMDLLNGRKWLAFELVCVFYALLELCKFSPLIWRWRGAQIVRVSLQAVIAVFGVAANVVLYMACKSEKEEPLNTLVAASAHFGPEACSPKSQGITPTEPN